MIAHEKPPLYFRVSPRIWNEEWGDDERLLAFYVLTCEHRLTEGLYRLPKGYILSDLGWSPERLEGPFAKLLADGFIEYDEKARVILVVKALKYQAPANDNVCKAAAKRLADMPETPLFAGLQRYAERYAKLFAILLPKLLPERYGKPPSLSSTSLKKELFAEKISAPKESDIARRAREVLEATGYRREYEDLAAILAADNKTGKVSLARVLRELYEPLLAIEGNGVTPASFQYGLQAAISKGAANANYVKKASANYDPSRTKTQTVSVKTPLCPDCGVDLAYDGDGTANRHCPVCGKVTT
jgi:ribosomal protein S27AE